MSAFSLVHGAWIPVRRADGTVAPIAPFEITSHHDTNPIVAFAWPRPDFDLAAHEFLIGLLAAIFPAHPERQSEWIRLFHHPPAPEELSAAFAPLADAFDLDGEGPRFLQDCEALEGEESPLEALFIEAPGANTTKLNKDLFVKRGQARVLSRAAAAMALYTLQQFAPSGGAGHRTSLRGGGPLVTLALPDGGEGTRVTLWQRLWLNTPKDRRLQPTDKRADAFPWLAPTKTSAKKEVVHEADVHALQAFFGMPRRIRLVFAKNEEKLPCDLTGIIDDVICTGFIAVPWGVNYGIWHHPLTPYYVPRSGANVPDLPVHAPEGRLGYREWLGLVFDGDVTKRAKILGPASDRLSDLGLPWKDNSRLLAGGYAMDNMKALAFAEAEMPLYCLDQELAVEVGKFARAMVKGTSIVASMLAMALRRALFGERSEAKADQTVLSTARERLWERTEDAFHEMLKLAIDRLADDPNGDQFKALAESWRIRLKSSALRIFEDTAPPDSSAEHKAKDIVEGRKQLVFGLNGRGKLGVDLFNALGLEPPEKK